MRGMVTRTRKSERQARAPNRVRAREMRSAPVNAEKLFWSEVRSRRLGGFKFKRQFLIGPYIADFVCPEKMLVVELDGPFHDDRAAYDADRDEFLRARGYRVMRFKNEQMAEDLSAVLASVLHALETPSPRPSPPLSRGRGGAEKQ